MLLVEDLESIEVSASFFLDTWDSVGVPALVQPPLLVTFAPASARGAFVVADFAFFRQTDKQTDTHTNTHPRPSSARLTSCLVVPPCSAQVWFIARDEDGQPQGLGIDEVEETTLPLHNLVEAQQFAASGGERNGAVRGAGP